MFKDTKVVIRSFRSKDRHHNDQMKKNNILPRQLKMEQHEHHKNPEMNSGSSEG